MDAQAIVIQARAARADGDDKRAAKILVQGAKNLQQSGVTEGLEMLIKEARDLAASSPKGKAREDARWATEIAAEALRSVASSEYERTVRRGAQIGRLLRGCTLLGGYGHGLVPGDIARALRISS